MSAKPAVIELHLLRHAHAGVPEEWKGDDAARPLSPKGERQSDRLGRFLASAGLEPDAIISSPKLRARQTAEIVGRHLHVHVAIDDRLGGGLDLGTIAAILADAGGPQRPIVAGHDPDFSELLAELTGAAKTTMRKGAIARIDVELPVLAGAGVLRWLIPPELL
jgi:phosphohistidine phosphatase